MRLSTTTLRGVTAAVLFLFGAWTIIQAGDTTNPSAGSAGNNETSSKRMLWERQPSFIGECQLHLLVPVTGDENRPLEQELNVGIPLDLTELALELDRLPELPHHNATEKADAIALASNDEPLQIGGEVKKTAECGSAQPPNPLRNQAKSAAPAIEPPTAEMAVELTEQPSTPKASPEDDASKSTDEPKPMTLDVSEIADAEKLPPASTGKTPKPIGVSTRPKMRTIEIDPVSEDEQEAPSLSKKPNDDSLAKGSSRDEDKAALDATKPIAADKTFVGKPSRGKLVDDRHKKSSHTDQEIRLQRVEQCLAYYLAHLETTVERSPWSVMHAMLPFGVEGEILVGNRRTNAIQWLCNNGTCRGQKLFTPTQRFFKPNIGGGVQGHEGQFLAMLAQSQVSADYPIVVGNRRFTVADLARYEMATCRERTELTFKLMGLSYYVDTSQVWTTDRRSRWNIEKLVKEELAQPVNGAACGGVHRLMGLTFALRQRQAEGRPIDGQFARADKYIKDFIEYTWKLQNPDGSFSTNWFESRGNEPNMERKVQTTGHILEWLAFTLPEEELHSDRFTKSIDFLLSKILDEREHKWPIGPRGHATRAVALFQQRTEGVQPGKRREVMAEQIQSIQRR